MRRYLENVDRWVVRLLGECEPLAGVEAAILGLCAVTCAALLATLLWLAVAGAAA